MEHKTFLVLMVAM